MNDNAVIPLFNVPDDIQDQICLDILHIQLGRNILNKIFGFQTHCQVSGYSTSSQLSATVPSMYTDDLFSQDFMGWP